MEQNQNFEYKGFKANGFVMFFVSLLVIAAGVWGIVNAARTGYGLTAILGIVAIIVGLFMFGGLMVIEPNQARVLVFFGKYRGNFLKEGFWWVNPFISVKKISLRARNLNAEPIKVNDKMGNPIMIGLVLVWKVKAEEIYKAVFNIDAPKPATTTQVNNGQTAITTKSASESRMEALANFVAVQSDAALRQVAGCYAYDNNSAVEGELSLRSNADEINDQLEQKLSERLDMAGIEVIEARINYLAYAPEIAAVMLRRQQADAIISAREKIVEGAVSMVKMAIDQLADNNVVELDEERKAQMVSNSYNEIFGNEGSNESIFELVMDGTTNANGAVTSHYGYSKTSGSFIAPAKAPITQSLYGENDLRLYSFTNAPLKASGDDKTEYTIAKYAARRSPINGEANANYWHGSSECPANWIIYRKTDVMLMKAQALAYRSDDATDLGKAFELVTSVNRRSLIAERDTLKFEQYNTQELMKTLVLDERLRELTFEGKRWYDLVQKALIERSTKGILELITKKLDSNAGAVQSKMASINSLFCPIYERELKLNPLLKQNPAFESNSSIEQN